MKTQMMQVEDICVVNFNGHIDFESADVFKLWGASFFEQKKVIFNLEGLSFVGSCGVMPFLETLVKLSTDNPKRAKLCGVGSEFLKVFESKGLCKMQIYDSQTEALQAIKGDPRVPECN